LELIVTCARHFEDEAGREITSILEDVGDASPQVTATKYPGILIVKTASLHTDIIRHVCRKIDDEPWEVRYISRIIPMFEVVSDEIDSIVKSATSQAQRIGKDETYRITIEKRDSEIRSAEIISQIAGSIENKVSLEKYDWIVLIEIIGNICGVSVLKEGDVLSIERLKRGSAD